MGSHLHLQNRSIATIEYRDVDTEFGLPEKLIEGSIQEGGVQKGSEICEGGIEDEDTIDDIDLGVVVPDEQLNFGLLLLVELVVGPQCEHAVGLQRGDDCVES